MNAALGLYSENDCPGHVASATDPKICGLCGTHIDSLRPAAPEDDEAAERRDVIEDLENLGYDLIAVDHKAWRDLPIAELKGLLVEAERRDRFADQDAHYAEIDHPADTPCLERPLWETER